MKRLRILSVAAVVLPTTLAAQRPATPTPQPTANPIVAAFKASGSRYGNWLVSAFDSIPASKYDYRPTPAQLTVGYIAQHLEEANYELCAPASGMKHATTARDSTADSVKARWPKDTLVARLKASVAFCDSALAHITDAQLTDEIPFGRPNSSRKIVRARFLVAFVTDLADHYSQISNYMRLNGMVPPSARRGGGGD